MRSFALSILLLLPCSLFAASATSPGGPVAPSVHGVVADSTGAIVPGAEVDLVDTNGAVAGSIHSDGEGNFQLVAPHTGSFTLVVSEPGFDTVRTPVTIAVPSGGSGVTAPAAIPALAPVHIVLPIAAVASTVRVNGDSEDANFGDFIEDKAAESPLDMTSFSLLKDKLGDVLCSLNERERQVLELRFGLGDGNARTLEEVGQQFRVTRERIRQIEAKALRKMRHPTRIRQLHGFLEIENMELD